ncbi:hypothetical protein BH09BAC2_BH09BAC2_11280 [soil metagenome]
MKRFEVILTNSKLPLYKFTTFLLALLHLVYFTFAAVTAFSSETFFAAVAVILFLSIHFINERKTGKLFFLSNEIFLLLAVLWALNQNYILVVICFALLFLSKFATTDIVFCFTVERIVKKQIFTKEYEWEQIEHVIFKDGILTIEFKNNAVLQTEVKNEEFINEIEFNAFVESCITKKHQAE